MNTFYHGDCKFVMKNDIPPESVDLIYLDPPFFTGKTQKGRKKWQPGAMEISFKDTKSYWGQHQEEMRKDAPLWLNSIPGSEEFKAYLYYMMVRLRLCKRVMKPTGSIYLHCDWRASHYLKMIMDEIFGVNNFRNEIVWEYYQGGKKSNQFGQKHDIIFFYTKGSQWTFNGDEVRVPYAPSTIQRYKTPLQDGKLHALNPKGKIIPDVWSDIHSISRSAEEREGYPTQKPIKLLERIIKASSKRGDLILDPFCGCGTAIIAAHNLYRYWKGIDISKDAYAVTITRKAKAAQHRQGMDDTFSYVERNLDEVMAMPPNEFEKWVNEYYKATKPHPDKGVDGITADGIAIQVKTFCVSYKVLSQFATDAECHPSRTKPVTKIIVVSQTGFDDGARQRRFEIQATRNLEVQLTTPEEMLK